MQSKQMNIVDVCKARDAVSKILIIVGLEREKVSCLLKNYEALEVAEKDWTDKYARPLFDELAVPCHNTKFIPYASYPEFKELLMKQLAILNSSLDDEGKQNTLKRINELFLKYEMEHTANGKVVPPEKINEYKRRMYELSTKAYYEIEYLTILSTPAFEKKIFTNLTGEQIEIISFMFEKKHPLLI